MGQVVDAPLILIIDDDEAVLQVYQELLEDEGYRLSVRAYPPPDTEELRGAPPDLVLLDLLFGAETAGWDFLQVLKDDATTAGIPVVIATADQRLVDQRRSLLDAWECGIILKPFDIDDLFTAVQFALLQSTHDTAGAPP
jgi:CheY-like chemotaxis protein